MVCRDLMGAQRERLETLTVIVEGLEFGNPDAALDFTGRLQREQLGWSRAFAERVVGEYRKFLILAAVSEAPITPSEAVDQAWHLHIVYTRSYHDWCDALFGGYLHHGPTEGGQVEAERFDEQYNATLALYTELFGEAPPADIWPPAHIRFSRRQLGAWIQPSEYWLLPRRTLKRVAVAALICLAVFWIVPSLSESRPGGFENTYAESRNDGESGSGRSRSTLEVVVIVGGVGVCVIGLLVVLASVATGNHRGKKGDGGGCSSWFGCGGGGCGAGCGGGGCGGCGG